MPDSRHIPHILAALVIAATCSPAESANGDVHTGRVEIVDGDTVIVAGAAARIRLYGIDAPEGRQRCRDADGALYLCGTRSADNLQRLVGRNGRLSCVEEDRDRYGRIVAECFRPDGVSVNAAMVAEGWAVEYSRYSDGRYRDVEREARRAGRGLWSGQFTPPADWRRGKRLPAEANAGGLERFPPISSHSRGG